MDWLLLSCIASGVLGLILLFVLGAFWCGDRADDLADYERHLAFGDAAIDELLRKGTGARNRAKSDFERRHSTRLADGEQHDPA